MKVLHLLAAGNLGGIEVLCKDLIQEANWDNRICFLFEEGEIYQKLKKQNYQVFSLKKENRNRKKIVQELKKYCKKEKIDIITVHHGGLNCNLVYMHLQKEMPNVKFVRYLHGSFDSYTYGNSKNILKNYLIKKVMQKALEQSDLLVFIAEAVKTSFEKNFSLKNKEKVVIYNGIHQRFFEQIPPKKKETEAITNITYVGRIEKGKGIHLLIRACEKLKKRHLKIHVTIVGDGKEQKRLEQQIEALKLKEIVDIAGKQENVIPWLDKTDIFVYPSICEEGFGISVVEAMARGCIPITFQKGGLVEIIENGKNGFIVEKVDDEALAQKISEVIQIKNREQIISNAIERSKYFTINRTMENLYASYKKLMKK